MDARSVMQRWLPSRAPDESLTVESESPSTLTLRQGRVVTALDRLSRIVTQQGRLVARFGAVRHVRVQQEGAQAGVTEWWVILQLAGTGSVKVGHCPDPSSATQLASRIGGVTGVDVVS